MPITSRDDILFYWDAIGRLAPFAGGGVPTLSRASSGLQVAGRAGLIETLRANTPRFPWVDIDGDRFPALLLEMAATNVALDSQGLNGSAWTAVNSPTVTADDIVAPDGQKNADKVEDAGVSIERMQQEITIANDSTSWCVSVFVRKKDAAETVNLWCQLLGGTTTKQFRIGVDPETGSFDASNFDADSAGVEDHGGWWRIWVAAANNSTGNTTLRISLVPAAREDGTVDDFISGDPTGSAHFWGVQAENRSFPSSYSGVTISSPVSRAVESLSWNNAPAPQPMVIYCDVVLVSPLAAAGRFFTLGLSSSAVEKQQLFVREISSTLLRFELRSVANTVIAHTGIPAAAAVGDRIQMVCVLNADGSGRFVVSQNGAAVQGNSMAAPADGLPSAWLSDDLWLNAGNALFINANKYRQLKIVKPGNLDAAVDGTADQALLDEMAELPVNQDGSVRV